MYTRVATEYVVQIHALENNAAMNLSAAFSVLRVMGTRHADALTAKQIVAKWNALYTRSLNLRTAQRYLSQLSADGADGDALVEVDTSGKEWRYHLKLSEMANWFMTEEAALYQVLSLQVLHSTFGETATAVVERQIDAAEYLSREQIRTRRLRDRVRIVPDGIGRLRARVASKTLGDVMDALAGNQCLDVEYTSAKGNTSRANLMPLALVAKDGALYLLAVRGLSDSPIAYALHRVKSIAVKPVQAHGREDFNIDDYIRASHQLSHALDDQPQAMGIKMKVSPQWLYHFEERPLCEGQKIVKPQRAGDWALVTAPIPITHMLRPFLASMGPGVEVLEPASLRIELAQWLHEAAALYSSAASGRMARIP